MRGKLALLTAAISLVGAGAAQAAQVGTFDRSGREPAVSRGLADAGVEVQRTVVAVDDRGDALLERIDLGIG